jgi:hypothetical protein
MVAARLMTKPGIGSIRFGLRTLPTAALVAMRTSSTLVAMRTPSAMVAILTSSALVAILTSAALVSAQDSSGSPPTSIQQPVAAAEPEGDPTAAPIPPPPPLLSEQPYRVRLIMSVSPIVATSFPEARRLAAEVRDSLARTHGPRWTFPGDVQCSLGGDAVAAARRASPMDLAAVGSDAEFDKIVFLTIMGETTVWTAASCEWDVLLKTLGPVSTFRASDRREITAIATQAVSTAFREIARIEQSREGDVSLLRRASALVAIDSSASAPAVAVASEDYFEPYYRFLNKQGQVDRITLIPWTYIVDRREASGSRSVTVRTGLRQAISARRRRTQAWALATGSHLDQTTVRCVLGRNRLQVLPGIELEVMTEAELAAAVAAAQEAQAAASDPVAEGPSAGEKSSPTETTAKPDDKAADAPVPKPAASKRVVAANRAGEAFVPLVDGKSQLVWLTARNGRATLARVPLLPGSVPVVVLELPDDTLRSQVEADLALLESDLIDAVARRSVVMARARGLAKSGKLDEARGMLATLDSLPGQDAFLSRVESIRLPAIEQANKQRNRMAAQRIRQQCDAGEELVRHYLNPDRQRAVHEEIAELTAAAARQDEPPPASEPAAEPVPGSAPDSVPEPSAPAPSAPDSAAVPSVPAPTFPAPTFPAAPPSNAPNPSETSAPSTKPPFPSAPTPGF